MPAHYMMVVISPVTVLGNNFHKSGFEILPFFIPKYPDN